MFVSPDRVNIPLRGHNIRGALSGRGMEAGNIENYKTE